MISNYEENPVQRERRLDANRAIAQKIRNRLNQLVNANEKDKRRWIWELLQNAKDTVTDRKVDIEIILSPDVLEFKHNGDYFSPRNVTNLVHQISSKEGTGSIGRFGTGFLTTHTLSRLVQVSGIYEEDSLFAFQITLDRCGSTEEELIQGIEHSWNSFNYKKLESVDDPWTSFKYVNPDSQVAKDTLKDFESSVLYTLAFVENLGQITVKDTINSTESSFCLVDKCPCTEEITILHFEHRKNDKLNNVYILYANNDEGIEIAIEIERFESRYKLKPIKNNVPRLFCAFPLIGTEKFPFPLIVNSANFAPKTERDGLYLQGETEDARLNKNLLEDSIGLYQKVLEYVSKQQWFDLYILAYKKLPFSDENLDHKWYQSVIQHQLRESLLTVPLVETETDKWIFIKHDDKQLCTYFPYDTAKEVREKIWDFTNLLFPNHLPKKEHIHDWFKILWSEENEIRQTIEELARDIQTQETIQKLAKTITQNEANTLKWLDVIIDFLEQQDSELLRKYSVLPNQYGVLKLKSDLYTDQKIPDELKEILKIIDQDWRDLLLNCSIVKADMTNRYKNVKMVSKVIDEYIDIPNRLEFHKNNNTYRTTDGLIYHQLEYQTKVKELVFSLIGYSGANEPTEDHQILWEFAREFYYDDIPAAIEKLNIDSEINLHQKSLKWLTLNLARDISELKDIKTLGVNVHGHVESIEWLNNFMSFVLENETYKHIVDLDEIPLLPNQDGILHSKEFLFQDGGIEIDLKEILKPLAPNWIGELLDTRINMTLPENKIRKFEDIAQEIDRTFHKYFSERKTQTPEFIKSFQDLLGSEGWLPKQDNLAHLMEEHFNWIARNKPELSLSILGDGKTKDRIFEIIQNGNIDELAEIQNNFSNEEINALITDSDMVKEFLKHGKSITSPTNDENISFTKLSRELGEEISSIEDLKRFIEKNQTLQFKSEPPQTSKDFDFEAMAQSNEEAKRQVKAHLQSQNDYELTGWHEDSNTIIGGVKRQGIQIKLVIKGADHGVVYFDRAGKEKKVLKKSFTELWVHSRGRVFQITIGQILENQNSLKLE